MKVVTSILRTVSVNMEHFRQAAETKTRRLATDAKGLDIEQHLRETFGPLNRRIKFFWPSTPGLMATVGIEAFRFEIRDAHVPQAGIATADPLDPREIALLDGTLLGELERLGIFVPDAKFVQWRAHYETEGN